MSLAERSGAQRAAPRLGPLPVNRALWCGNRWTQQMRLVWCPSDSQAMTPLALSPNRPTAPAGPALGPASQPSTP